MNGFHSSDTTGVWIGGLISIFGMAMVFLPGALGMDMMNAGYALIFIGGFVVIIGLVTALVYGQRVRELSRALADKNILARWTYSAAQSQQQIEQEYVQYKTNNRSLFMIMLAWFIVIGGAFLGVDLFQQGEVNWLFAGLFFGVLAILAVVATITPLLWRRQAMRASREVIIARNGLVLNGAFHTWAPPLNKLVGVQYIETGDNRLEFEIRYLSRASVTAHSTYIVAIPVPAGKESAAQDIVRHFEARG